MARAQTPSSPQHFKTSLAHSHCSPSLSYSFKTLASCSPPASSFNFIYITYSASRFFGFVMERTRFIPPSDFGVARLASQSAVVIFSKSTCCMCHSISTLFNQLGVNPTVHELDQDPKGRDMERVLISLGVEPAVPAVFIRGQLVGGAKEVMTRHLDGTLLLPLR